MSSHRVSSARSELLAERARAMRSAPTASEARLWAALSGSQLGVGFRRQVVVSEAIVDFVAPSHRLVIEVDGGYHTKQRRADARRNRRLSAAGYRVLRIPAELVLRDLPAALSLISAALSV